MPVVYRPGTMADSQAANSIMERSFVDMAQRLNGQSPITVGDPKNWEGIRSLFEHLGRTAEHFWIAELDGAPIGYARSILRDGVRELTEFFVLPNQQSAGVGRELLARAFPAEGARHRSIIATTNPQSLSRYLRAGVTPRTPIFTFSRNPSPMAINSDLAFEPITSLDSVMSDLNQLDQNILGYVRGEDHGWLAQDHNGFVYRRGGRVVGYGYIGISNGPFALENAGDFPAVLAHAETQGAARHAEQISFEVPLINRAAVEHLLQRHYVMDVIFMLYMSDAPLGRLENYLTLSPPVFL
jgi:GNAT superfamily N-acetyltransferase